MKFLTIIVIFYMNVAVILSPAYGAESSPPVLVELFTSEGCNSCPPADALLNELSDYKNIVTIAYHVTYWDYLGWKDELATKWGTQRQKKYARMMRSNQIFTPQMIIDGRHSEVGSKRHDIQKLISRRQRDENRIKITIKPIETGKYQVSLDSSKLKGSVGKAEIRAIYYRAPITNSILAGENRGKKLSHRNVAFKQEVLGSWKKGKQNVYIANKPLENEVYGVAIFVQNPLTGVVIGSQKFTF